MYADFHLPEAYSGPNPVVFRPRSRRSRGRANNAVVDISPDGDLALHKFPYGTWVHVILDVTGDFQ